MDDNRTLTELLFKGQTGTIFSCKILTMTTPKSTTINGLTVEMESEDGIDGTATAEIVQVYFGKIDTKIITLKTGSFLTIGKTYLIYTSGNGKLFWCGGNCDKWTKKITDNPDSTYEVKLIKQFCDIFTNKKTGKYSFTNSKGVVIAEGQYKEGEPIKVWKHYYDSGIIKAVYDLKNNIISQYSAKGFIKEKTNIDKKVSIYEQYSAKVNGQLKRKDIETKNDTGFIDMTYEHFDNGNLQKVSSQIIINVKNGVTTAGLTGIYEEYYENGTLYLKGQYDHNKKVGIWNWYKEDGKFDKEFDYKDGTNEQSKK